MIGRHPAKKQSEKPRGRGRKTGLAPGTLVHIGKPRSGPASINVLDYDAKHLEERPVKDIEEAFRHTDNKRVSWVNIYGIHDLELIEKVGKHFGLHPLTLEDLVNTEQRPKYEEYEEYGFFVLKMISVNGKRLELEQISLILGNNYVLCFQEQPGDIFDNVRERLRTGKRIRSRGADYLAYALIDTVVDGYFSALERFGERLEEVEADILDEPHDGLLRTLQGLKRDTVVLRKAIWPLRDLVGSLERGEAKHLQAETLVYMRDVYDHAVQVIDTLQTYREMLAGLLDIYLSAQSNQMNEIMKVLTVISTIFIPLTFITGVYGMNFHYMPELAWEHGYAATLGLMVVIAAGLLWFFRRKEWI